MSAKIDLCVFGKYNFNNASPLFEKIAGVKNSINVGITSKLLRWDADLTSNKVPFLCADLDWFVLK